jgi:hypothetical protein
MLISLSLYELSAPYTYPILLLLTGNGRFNDWYLTLGGVSNYPQVIDGICTIPWIYAYFLIKMNSYFGIFYSHIIYVFASLSILFFSYRRLNISFDKTTSFLLIFTYPILFGFWRGNSDFLIYGLILASYFYGANYTYTSSLLYLGSAIAFKPYQVFLLFAFKLKILWDNILIIFLGIMTIIIFIYIANNDFFTSSYKEIIKCGAWYTKEYAIADGGTLHNNSLWGLSKLVVYYFYNNGGQVKVIEFMSIYLEMWPFLLIGVFLILNSFVRLFNSDHNRFSTKFFLICLLIPLLSPIVPDYRLFFLNVCLIICLTNKMAENINLKVLVSILVFILIPKEFRWFALNGAWFTPNGALNCIAMLILLGYIIVKNLKVKKLPQRNPI